MTFQQVENLLGLAKQGHPQAIVALINRQLKVKEITATASIHNSCLCILLEALTVPERNPLAAMIWQGMMRLNPEQIDWVKVCSKRFIDEVPEWEYQFRLPLKQTDVSLKSQLSDPFAAPDQTTTQKNQAMGHKLQTTHFEAVEKDDSHCSSKKQITLPKEEFWNVLGHVILQNQ